MRPTFSQLYAVTERLWKNHPYLVKIMVDIVPNSQVVIGHGAFSVVYKASLNNVSFNPRQSKSHCQKTSFSRTFVRIKFPLLIVSRASKSSQQRESLSEMLFVLILLQGFVISVHSSICSTDFGAILLTCVHVSSRCCYEIWVQLGCLLLRKLWQHWSTRRSGRHWHILT